MPKGTNQKLKLYYLAKIMVSKTDDTHFLTMPEIQELLEKQFDVTADRKSLYDDMEQLRVLGIDIIGEKIGRKYGYHVGSKQFELAELKLLVDSIQASKFITERKSAELIKKLTSLASEYEASQLKRQVVVQGRIKTMNESIYYSVDYIHSAIIDNRQIRFKYYKWDVHKEMVPRKEGFYQVSPWALTWDDENYYLIAYDLEASKIKHYRVDKMRNIEVLEDKRMGKEVFASIDMAAYSSVNFGMYGGEKTLVKLMFKEDIVGVILDRFGKDITIRSSAEKDWYETNVDVAISDQFFGWVVGLGNSLKIASPKEVVDKFKDELDKLRKMY